MSHPPRFSATPRKCLRPADTAARVNIHIWGSLGLALLVPVAPVQAQDERPTGYPRSANERADKPVEFSVVYTAELRGNASGGIKRGVRYLDNLDVQVAIDADRLVGWRGARLFAYAIYNNGQPLSELVGDNQGVSNIETDVKAVRLFEAWVEQDVGNKGSIKAGLYNVNSEFDTTQSGGLFLLSSHGIGPDLSQSGRSGPSIFPRTSLAIRGAVALGEHWLARAAVLDGVPDDPAHPRRTAIKLSARDGALVVGEIDYLNGGTKAAIGAWSYTARFERIAPNASSGHGNKGAYIFAEHRLVGNRSDDAAGLAGWLRFGLADARYNPIGRYLGGGLVYSGLGSNRKGDQIGISFAAAEYGSRYRVSQRLAGADQGAREIVFEAVYNVAIASWLSVQPDAQYILNPSGNRDVEDAVVIGLRVKIGS
jgi:porin